MPSPTKRQKLNSNASKTPPAGSRTLDYFFGKHKKDQTRLTNDTKHAEDLVQDTSDLADEQLARKLQAQWDQEPSSVSLVDGAQAQADFDEEFLGKPSTFEMKAEVSYSIGDAFRLNSGTRVENAETVANPRMGPGFTSNQTLALQSASAVEDNSSAAVPLDTSTLNFEPHKYIQDLQKDWATGSGDAFYSLLTKCFVLVNSTQSRIKIVDTLVNLLRSVIEADPSSLLPTVWLATNSISPPYISLELGLGGSAISKALKQVYGLDNRSLKTLYDKHGDAGDVAFEAKKKQKTFTFRKPKPLTIKGVYQSLVKIAKTQGTGSGEVKQRIVETLLQDARGAEESRYIVRTLCQHLRIGAVKTTMLIALSRAFLLSRPSGAEFTLRLQNDLAAMKKEGLTEVWSKAEDIVKACFARRPNYNDLIPALLEVGICEELLIRCGLSLHVPLRPMLGSITRDLPEMLTRLQGSDFTCEYKYDGQRAQVHCDEKGRVSIFSRHLEWMTDKYPDLVALIPQIRGEGVSSFIMEGEVVAINRQSGDLKAFQALTNRARKDVAIGSIKVDVCLFAFDLMYLNGEPLLDRPFRERRELLRSLFTEVPMRFEMVKSIDSTSQDSETILEFFKSAINVKCEGIMVKILDNLTSPTLRKDWKEDENATEPKNPTPTSAHLREETSKIATEKGVEKAIRRKALLSTYEPDKRLDSWLKVKKDYSNTFDTIDLIPIAGWHGQGRKAKWWSPILLAVRNDSTGSLEAVCKCISGFTDAFYKANKEFYIEGGPNVLGSKPSYVDYEGGYPDVWFEPQEVWEMAFADITISPVYKAAIGLVSDEKGLSLRFPRFLKKKEDKSIEEASTSEFLAGLWKKQDDKAPRSTEKLRYEVEDEEEA